MLYQGAPLTPFAETAQTSRRGFDAILNVAREQIALKQQKKDMASKIAMQKDLIDYEAQTNFQTQKKIYEEITGPEEEAQRENRIKVAQLNATGDMMKALQDRNAKVRTELFTKYGDVLAAGGASIGTIVGIDVSPETGESIVTFSVPKLNEQTGTIEQANLQLTETQAHAYLTENKPVADFFKKLDDEMDNLEETSRLVDIPNPRNINRDGRPVEVLRDNPLIGRDLALKIRSEISRGTVEGQRYLAEIKAGRYGLNIKQDDVLEREKAENLKLAGLAYAKVRSSANFTPNAAGFGQVKIAGWGDRPEGAAINLTAPIATIENNFKQSLETIYKNVTVGEGRNQRELTPIEAFKFFDPTGYAAYESLNNLMNLWYMEGNNQNKTDKTKLYFNFNRSAAETDINSMFNYGSQGTASSSYVTGNL